MKNIVIDMNDTCSQYREEIDSEKAEVEAKRMLGKCSLPNQVSLF